MFNKLKIVNLSVLICQNCSLFYNKDTNILEVPSKKVCFLINEEAWEDTIIEHINIHGIVSIPQEIGLKIRYKYFSMSKKGVLEIGEQDSSYPFEVVFEQVITDADCEKSIPTLSLEGRISMKSFKQIHMPIYEDSIKVELVGTVEWEFDQLTLNQETIVINFDYSHPFLTYAKIGLSDNKTLSLPGLMIPKFNDIERIPKPLFISSAHQEKGIRFLNTCSSLVFDQITGVQFINPKYLLLVGNQINNSLFITRKMESEQESVFKQRVEIHTGVVNCHFIGIEKVDLKQNFNTIQNSVFLNSTIESESTQLVMEGQNYFVFSNINLINVTSNSLANLILSNSTLLISSSQLFKELIIKSLCFINHSSLILKLELEKFIVQDSTFIESSIHTHNIFRMFMIQNTFVYQKANEFFFIEIEEGFMNSLQNQILKIKNCTIIGQLQTLVNSPTKIEDQVNKQRYLNCLGQKDYLIYISEDTLINSLIPKEEQKLQLFNLPCRVVNLQYKQQKYSVYYIEEYNQHYPHMLKQHYRYLTRNEYLIKSPPAFLLIKDVSFMEDKILYSVLITASSHQYLLKKEYFEIFEIQLMPDQEVDIVFLDYKQNKLEVLYLKLQLINYYSTDSRNQAQYYVRFNKEIHSIREFIIKNVSFVNEMIDYKLIKMVNYFKLVWKSGAVSRTDFEIKLDICELERFNYELSCNSTCDKTVVKNYCFNSCSSEKSLFEDGSQCSSCHKGCSVCTQQGICVKCEDGFLLLDGICITDCSDTYFYEDGLCKKCSDSCKSCSNELQCNVCKNDEISPYCLQCSEGFYLYEYKFCLSCSPLCQNCFGSNPFECVKCSTEAVEKYGICVPIQP